MWFKFLGRPPPAMYQPIPEGTSTNTRIPHSVRYAEFYHLSSSVLLFVCLLQSTAIIYLLRFALGRGHLSPAVTPVPPIPWETVEFTRDGLMHDLRHGEDVENAWRNYETTAFVHIPNPQAYSLHPNKGVIAGTENVYMISAHHQLHCLKKLQLNHVAAVMVDADHMITKEHAEHCFDYLRQAILCAADSTLEGVDPGRPGLLQGYGATHQCRAWNGPKGLDTWRQMHCAGEGLGYHK